MKEFFSMQWQGYRLLKEHFNKFMGYQLMTSLVMFLILLPAFKGIFNLMMKTSGFDYITNGLVKKLLISPQGIVIVLSSIIMGSLIVLIQLGGLIVLSHQLLVTGKESSYVQIVRYTFRRLKYMLGLDGLLVVLYFVVLAPMLGGEIRTSIFDDLAIPGFIMQVIESNVFYLISLFVLIGVILYLAFRWLFALHVLLLDADITKRF